jgi:predicted metal-dependent hydrolase
MVLDWKEGALAEGLACYRNFQFFDAHEHWESVWLTSILPQKSFLQALIQLTVALHHLQAGNPAGARSLMKRVHRRLEECPACFGGIDVALLRTQVAEWIGMLNGQVPQASMNYPHISPLEFSRE